MELIACNLISETFPPTVSENHVVRDGETSGLRDLCVRRAGPFGGADSMKEV